MFQDQLDNVWGGARRPICRWFQRNTAHVCFGSKAEVTLARGHVCFVPLADVVAPKQK